MVDELFQNHNMQWTDVKKLSVGFFRDTQFFRARVGYIFLLM